MPLQIQRTVTVYKLWDDGDVKAACQEHAAAGWIAEQRLIYQDGQPSLSVSLQNTATKQLVTATHTQVIVSDLRSVVAQTVDEYNTANPDNLIEVES